MVGADRDDTVGAVMDSVVSMVSCSMFSVMCCAVVSMMCSMVSSVWTATLGFIEQKRKYTHVYTNTQALRELVDACRPGVNASHLCLLGDHLVTDLLRLRHPARAHQLRSATNKTALAASFSTKEHGPDRARVTAKDLAPEDAGIGLAFPTTVAVNNQVSLCA